MLIEASLGAATELSERQAFDGARDSLRRFWDRPMSADLTERYAEAVFKLGIAFYRIKRDPTGGASLLRKATEMAPANIYYRANAALYARNYCQYELALEYLDALPDELPGLVARDDPFAYQQSYLLCAWCSDAVPRAKIREKLKRYVMAVTAQLK